VVGPPAVDLVLAWPASAPSAASWAHQASCRFGACQRRWLWVGVQCY